MNKYQSVVPCPLSSLNITVFIVSEYLEVPIIKEKECKIKQLCDGNSVYAIYNLVPDENCILVGGPSTPGGPPLCGAILHWASPQEGFTLPREGPCRRLCLCLHLGDGRGMGKGFCPSLHCCLHSHRCCCSLHGISIVSSLSDMVTCNVILKQWIRDQATAHLLHTAAMQKFNRA